MKYEQKRFSVPVGSNKVTQEHWDSIFGNKNRLTIGLDEEDDRDSEESQTNSDEEDE